MFHVKTLDGPALPVRRLDELCARYHLDAGQRDRLATILVCLAADEHAPTAIRDELHALEVHLADSLVALELECVRAARAIADLGSGAGFPGLPLAVALPASEVYMVESQRRKATFSESLSRAAGAVNAHVVCARAEEWRAGQSAHDLVVARALAPSAIVLEYASPLLRLRGALVEWRGQRDSVAEHQAESAASELGLRLLEIRRVEPYEGAREHHLHVYEKVGPTPSRFPRRPGVARKRPLGC